MQDNNKFYFDSEGNIEFVKFQSVLGFTSIVYLLAGTILQYCDTKNITWRNEEFCEGTYHWHSDIPNGIDKQIEKYTNWCDGCSLNNTLYSAAKFIYDLEKDIVNSKRRKSLFLMWRECSYVGYAINGVVNKRALEIIPDALECYAEYVRQQDEHAGDNRKNNFDWCEYNKAYKELFELNQ